MIPLGRRIRGSGFTELLAGDVPVGLGQPGVVGVELLHVGGDLVRLLHVVEHLVAHIGQLCHF